MLTPTVVRVVLSGGTDWPAIVAAISTGVVGVAGIIGTAWQSKRGRDLERDARRRDVYAVFILALDHLERTWNAPETLEAEHLSQEMGEVTAEAVREIQRAYVTVLLVGSKKAKQEAVKVRRAAWALNHYLWGGSRDDPLKSKLSELLGGFTNAGKVFIEIAEAESGGQIS